MRTPRADLTHPIDRWEPYAPEVCLTGGPERVITTDPDIAHTPTRRVGFRPPVAEPLTWEGDDS